jgi:hypothetical protein
MNEELARLDEVLMGLLAGLDHYRVAEVYEQGAAIHSATDAVEEACFYWTNALVFALQHGEWERVERLRSHLEKHKRI